MAKDAREAGVVIPRRVRGGGKDGMVIFLVYFACSVDRIGIICVTIPGIQN